MLSYPFDIRKGIQQIFTLYVRSAVWKWKHSANTNRQNKLHFPPHITYSAVELATRSWPGRSGLRFPAGPRHFSPKRSDRLWNPPILISNWYGVVFFREKSGREGKLISHLHLMPSVRMSRAIYPVYLDPYEPLWPAQLQLHLYPLQCKLQQSAGVPFRMDLGPKHVSLK
jgi:hypothetical protein